MIYTSDFLFFVFGESNSGSQGVRDKSLAHTYFCIYTNIIGIRDDLYKVHFLLKDQWRRSGEHYTMNEGEEAACLCG